MTDVAGFAALYWAFWAFVFGCAVAFTDSGFLASLAAGSGIIAAGYLLECEWEA